MYVIDDPIPTEKWRIKIPRNVMKRFLGTDHEYLAELAVNFPKFLNAIGHVKPYFTDRFEPTLNDNEKEVHINITGDVDVSGDIHGKVTTVSGDVSA